jgi:hypothetical protein
MRRRAQQLDESGCPCAPRLRRGVDAHPLAGNDAGDRHRPLPIAADAVAIEIERLDLDVNQPRVR